MTENAVPTVLFVEDEMLVALAIISLLEDAGFAVIHAASGEQAFAALEGETARLVALITDIRLPGGIDGWAIAHRARELNPALPIVYASGDSASEWASKGVPHSLMLQKPFADSQLVAAVTTLLNQAAART